ncbi:class I SAM-dependent methyltransferase [Alicyclobacillus cycloheptanicus]|uniref:Cyclopropane fatty-acyl-phospholipid synthase-like methyltransferase n=1 Tax=Alicyclobacillus cycloheptanicus TaxID=1457 RepID=A0ABT9XE01_9BACL|nr:class I SAM-dependent methyltransferase [Alicyclobacillus cycloheptanicus]MDQ0188530.1 cyclopropane fatty-acyl-phospholipid synthase-like methyltransferase [Alicyclobacillus cycloheptanicus]WDM01215.1 class I SAM-dependent methyltransferase [Alicyclobacillus cycloheptanicus]
MDHQQARWNEKYANRAQALSDPDEFLVQRLHLLQPGTVLDVACGDGRHAIYLARHGFQVTGVDFSELGLKRLATFASNEGLQVTTYHRDVKADGALADLGPFDNVIVTHFKPSLHTFNELVTVLRTGGMLLMTSFNTKQHDEKGFPRDFCYREGEYVRAHASLERIEYTSYTTERGYFDGYVFRKRSGA